MPQVNPAANWRNAVTRLHPWHEELMNVILAHPTVTNAQLAVMFKRTEPWISVVRNSNMFQAMLKARQQKRANAIDTRLNERVLELAQRGVERLHDKFDHPDADVLLSTGEIVRITSMALQAVGKEETRPAPQVTNNILIVDKSDLADAREKLRLHSAHRQLLEQAGAEPNADAATDPDSGARLAIEDASFVETE